MDNTRAIQRLERSNPAIFDQAFTDLAELQKLSSFLLESGMCPDHFYEKSPDGKVDRTKGKVAALGMTLLHGNDLGLPPMTAMQWVVQVNGLMSIKGDGAAALINSSGKLHPGSWSEETTGSISEGTYKVTISAKRSDNGKTATRSFSVQEAKRAGLWITDQQVNSKDGWKFRKSSWYKYPERMIYYRALGFLARDLFSDVLYGTYTTEEAMDMPQDPEIIIEPIEGKEIVIPDKEFSADRSTKLTQGAVDEIEKKNHKEEYPMTPEEAHPEPKGNLSGTATPIKRFTAEDLKAKDVKELHKLIEEDPLMVKAREAIPGMNTNRKLRDIIMHFQAGSLISHIAAHDPTAHPDLNDPSTNTKMPNMGAEPEPQGDQITEVEIEDPADGPLEGGNLADNIPIEIPELGEKGVREFHDVKQLNEELSNVLGVDNKRFEYLAETKLPKLQEYANKEDFCLRADREDVLLLIGAI